MMNNWPLYRKTSAILIIITLGLLILSYINVFDNITFQKALFFVFFTAIGLPHGAMDHILYQEIQKQAKQKTSTKAFILKYLVIMLIYGMLWVFFPTISLIVFTIISAYHFGESQMFYCFDNEIKRRSKRIIYFLWGINVLGALLLIQRHEVQLLINSVIPKFTLDHPLYLWVNKNYVELLLILFALNVFGMLFMFFKKKLKRIDFVLEIFTLVLLFLFFWITPLMIGLLIYFGLWHSIKATQQIFTFYKKQGKPLSIKKFYLMTFRFTIISVLGVLTLFGLNYYAPFINNYVLLFLIIISILTLPHFHLFSKIYDYNK